MAQTTFRLDDDLKEWAEGRLPEPINKSTWYRYAVETTVSVDEQLDELYEPYQYDERQEFIEAAVREKIERTKNDANRGHDP